MIPIFDPIATAFQRIKSTSSPWLTGADTGVSPVIGVVIMIVITILLASVIGVVVLSMEDQLIQPDWDGGSQNPWGEDLLFGPENPIAGAEDVRYRVYFELVNPQNVTPLNTMTISVDAEGDDMFSGTDENDLETFDLIRHNGSVIDMKPVDKWTADENNLTISPETGAEVLGDDIEFIEIIFGGVDNPLQAGTYNVTIAIDQGDIPAQHGELEIIEP